VDTHRCLEAYRWGKIPGTVIFPDVPPTLELLRAHGIRVGIVTNAHQPMHVRDVEIQEHGIFDFFPDCRISAADVGYLKPHPLIFQTALRCVGTHPDETVFVGDDPEADIVGAHKAGLRAVLRRQTRRKVSLDSITPDAEINGLDELLPILDQWYPGWRD
jgi:putative hydrolase of the HAD superfamily